MTDPSVQPGAVGPPPIVIQLGAVSVFSPTGQLIIGPPGIGYRQGGTEWFVSWPEIGRVTVEASYYQSLMGVQTNASRLMIQPADPGFGARHPTLQLAPAAPGTPYGGYAAWLGSDFGANGRTAWALSQFAGPRFGGLVDHGRSSLF